jgi:DNA-binding response OmpR family regulator
VALSDFGAVLVLDSEKCALGEAALQLVRAGVHTLYANDLDEAALLARQERGRVRGVLLSAAFSPAQVDEVLETIAPHTRVQAASLVLVGAAPADETVEALRERGVNWCLREPYDGAELRFLATLAIWEGSDADLRIEPRVPTALRGSVTVGGKTRPVRVADLTTGGAFLELDSPPTPGRNLGLTIELPEQEVQIVAYVRWARAATAGPPERAAGAGVEFKPPRPADAAALRTQMAVGLSRYRL